MRNVQVHARVSLVQLVCTGFLLHMSGATAEAQPRDQDDSAEVKVAEPRFPLRGRGKGGFDKWQRKPERFHPVEATVGEIQAALQARQLTCTELVTLYLERIEAYSGTCTAYLDEQGNPKPADLFMPSGKTIQLGTLTAIANAGQVNAFSNLNVRGMRSETDLADSDPAIPDALEVAASLDAYVDSTRKLIGPLHCIPFAIEDQVDTYDVRTTDAAIADYANDRPPQDATLVAKLRAAGAIILGKANMGEYASGTRSTYQGQTCNPYATDRNPGGSSAGSGAAVAGNLVTCAIAEESPGSIRNPASMQGVVGVAPSRGLISREGNFDHGLFPHQLGERSPNLVINLRRLSSGAPPGEFGQGKYAFTRYLLKRGNANITSVADLNDVIAPCTEAAFETDFCGKARALFVGKNPPSNTATRLDLPGEASHLFRQQALREIVLHVMAANKLDALVYPQQHTVPSALLFQPSTVNVESRPAGGWNALTDVSRLPDMVVPGGSTNEATSDRCRGSRDGSRDG